MTRFRRRFAACLAALFVLGPVVPTLAVSGSTAATIGGNDFSWPQCAKGVGNGQGQPLPAAHRDFMIVGLTDGVGLHENPCLAAQWQYARDHADRVITRTRTPTRPGNPVDVGARDPGSAIAGSGRSGRHAPPPARHRSGTTAPCNR
jgi:hypothetical protein